MAGMSIASHMSEYASDWLPRTGIAASMTIPPMMGPMSIPRSSPVKAVLLAAPRRDGGTEGQRGGLEQRAAASESGRT